MYVLHDKPLLRKQIKFLTVTSEMDEQGTGRGNLNEQ